MKKELTCSKHLNAIEELANQQRDFYGMDQLPEWCAGDPRFEAVLKKIAKPDLWNILKNMVYSYSKEWKDHNLDKCSNGLSKAFNAAGMIGAAEILFIVGMRALADFFGCSLTTVKRWKHSGRIPFVQRKYDNLFFIPDLMKAIETDEVVRKQYCIGFLKKHRPQEIKTSGGNSEVNLKVKTTLHDEFLWGSVGYQGYHFFFGLPCDYWGQDEKIHAFIRKIIMERNKVHPFRKKPQWDRCANVVMC